MKRILLAFTFISISCFLYSQATLPVSRADWTGGAPTGWTDVAGSPYTTNCDGSSTTPKESGKLDTQGDFFKVNFSGTPDQLVVKVKGQSLGGTYLFKIQESVDGSTWTDLEAFDDTTNPLSGSCSTKTYSLGATSTYVQFLYEVRGSGNVRVDDVEITTLSQTVGFDNATSTETETNATFTVDIPVTMSNYGGSQVDLSVAVTGGTAEPADYNLNTSSLSFTANGTQNISIDIKPDADSEPETVEITLMETIFTGVSIVPSIHTLTINDDDTPDLVINEIHYNPCVTQGNDGDFEFIEIYNNEATAVDISNFSMSGVTFTFPASTSIAAGEYIIIASNSASYTGNGYQVFDYSGSLLNGGETIQLLSDVSAIVDEVTYTSGAGGNGNCRSIELASPSVENSNTSTNWGESSTTNGTPGGANILLPVELVYFKGKQRANVVNLNWQTATETDNDYFDIEHSTNGIDFENIATVIGAGTTTQASGYTIVHETPSSGENFYRLKQTDFDGHFEYVKTIVVDVRAGGEMNLFPSHARESVTFKWSETAAPETISVFDMTGRFHFQMPVNAENEQMDINLQDLPTGAYLLKVQSGRSVETMKFFKIQ